MYNTVKHPTTQLIHHHCKPGTLRSCWILGMIQHIQPAVAMHAQSMIFRDNNMGKMYTTRVQGVAHREVSLCCATHLNAWTSTVDATGYI